MLFHQLRILTNHLNFHKFFDQVDDVDYIPSKFKYFKKKFVNYNVLPYVVDIFDYLKNNVNKIHKYIIFQLNDLFHLYSLQFQYMENETNNQYQLDLIELIQYVLYYSVSIKNELNK